MGLRVTPDRVDPAAFPPPAPPNTVAGNAEDEDQPTAGATAVEEVNTADEAAEVTADEAVQEERERQQAQGQGGTQPPAFGPTLPGGNIDIVA